MRHLACFLRRYDPFQVQRVEQPSEPQSQSSAEDTPTSKASDTLVEIRRKENLPYDSKGELPAPEIIKGAPNGTPSMT